VTLESGTRLGVYEVLAALGAGGMGEVYRARDTRLNRDVALKILPDAFVTDRERVARFEREAQLLAALNHPNIATIYGLEKSGDTQFLVLEIVEGESLAERLRQGALPVDTVLSIARQLVEALEAAHEKGIVHRDLKPGNIMLSADGRVKVLDFGLAKFDENRPGSSVGDLTHSPTMSFHATQAGVILGTAAYMSPEQAKGRDTDKRADVWAFGCVLYEMLAGRRAFEGEDLSDTLATVLKSDPDWKALPGNLPAHVRAILKGCLEKDRKGRIPDISVVRYVMDGTLAASAPPVDIARRGLGLRAWQAATAVFVLATLVGIPITYLSRSTIPSVARFFVLPPDRQVFTAGGRLATTVVISPDGRRLAFTARDATGKNVLWIRPIDSLTAQSLAGTDGAGFPFWSPDSRFVGYFSNNKLLKIDVTGGPPQSVCTCNGRGATWSREGVIVLNNGQGPLFRVSAAGGQPSSLTKLTPGQASHVFPSFLPDARHVLFYGQSTSEELAGVYVVSLETGETKRLGGASSGGLYAGSGYLLFVRDGTLLAQSFSARTLTLSGEPFPVAEHVESAVYSGVLAFSASDTGVLAYGTGAGANFALQMVWVDRQGKAVETVGPAQPQNYRGLDLAPDGKRVAAHRHDGQGGDIWMTELSRGTTSRFTFDTSQDASSPIWSPDGRSIVFGASRGGKWGLYQKPSNGSGNEEKLIESDNQILPMSWAPDGRSLVYLAIDPKTQLDLWVLPLSGKPFPFANTPFNESHGQISPDGKWLAYNSTESGQNEVYVRPFPTGAGKWQISTGVGAFPRWRADGRELFYMSSASNGKLMAVDVKVAGTTFEAGTPTALFDDGYINLPHPGNYHTYAVSHDGQRFLIPRPPSSATVDSGSSPIVVVLNWAAGIK
jgi:Tol biopolymer transport system component